MVVAAVVADATLTPRAGRASAVTLTVSTGPPVDHIAKAAARARADLIVMGTHGLTGAKRVLIGSTTLGVLQTTTVPVLAVPGSGGPAGRWAAWPGSLIAAAIDLDNTAGANARLAAHIARWFGTSLLLVHVVTEAAAPAWLQTGRGSGERNRVLRARRQLETVAARVSPVAATHARVLHGNPATELAVLLKTDGIGLVVTALRDRRSWFGAGRGSISYHVLSHTVTPVLAIPPTWRRR